jgi:hypothetical protein
MKTDSSTAHQEIEQEMKAGRLVACRVEFKSWQGHVNAGPFVEGFVRAVPAAEHSSEADADDYEVRELRIPALYVVALWLRGRRETG